MSNDRYLNNPLIHRARRLALADSSWVRSFSAEDMKPLIICRGPIRKEVMDVLDEMGIDGYGILLSEKDSITYINALAPELRKLTDPSRVHRVPDYTGANKEERQQRIRQIVRIAHDNGYNSIFAGYGFMSEDAEMVQAMEDAGLIFIGPGSFTQRAAGLKDEAKRTALAVGVSVTPGVNNATALALIAKYKDAAGLARCIKEFKLDVDLKAHKTLEAQAEAVLAASYRAQVDVISVDDVGAALQKEALRLFKENPDNRFRLKAISGGGGKGQRILSAPSSYSGGSADARAKQAADKTPALVREVLAEVKCNGVGDNKNVLLEMNVETTRHQEIQVVGNGDWCITLGGRDCSLQMHEQKLLEVSVIKEDLVDELAAAKEAGRKAEATQLARDIDILDRMEAEAVRFGEAVRLNSVATFECIVDGERHYFMEMNTRIQVEHRVTELCYGLRFTNPENPAESFVVESLVEAMVLIARHGTRLPKPERVLRKTASVEARLNATNQALQPHAGGMIEYWSDPLAEEIRDDQGISLHNPDTGVFMKYHLAGAYDSNIALLLTHGRNRRQAYERLAEILRITKLSGKNLATNLEFHYGLVNWFLGQNVNARPTTRFIVPYLTAVAELKEQANNVDLAWAYKQIRNAWLSLSNDTDYHKATERAIHRKSSLLERVLERLLAEPHLLAGWLSLHQTQFQISKQGVTWLQNPLRVLADIYHYLNMDYRPEAPAAQVIWDHDHRLLQDALAFYDAVEQKLGSSDWAELQAALAQAKSPPKAISAGDWEAARAAHLGYQAGLEILSVLPFIADSTGFFKLKVNADLSIAIPERLLDKTLQERMTKVLVPPPAARADEIVAQMGGMFYAREAPGLPPYLAEGTHFNKGDPLYIVEVMKMFNKVYAEFSGTVEKVLMLEADGVIITKGQPLFKVRPDEEVVIETPEAIQARKRQYTDKFVARVLPGITA